MKRICNSSSPWLPELTDQVQRALKQRAENNLDLKPALQYEREQLESQIQGWGQSLAKPDLAAGVRASIEAQWTAALNRQGEIDAQLAEENNRSALEESLVQPAQVLERLNRLAEVLAKHNPTLGNLELSLHIDRINCFPDGKVEMRTCKLGTLTEAVDLFSSESRGVQTATPPAAAAAASRPSPRRRSLLRVADLDDDQNDWRTQAEFVADPHRFAGLCDQWFWTDTFHIPGRPLSWAARNAEAVFRRRVAGKLSYHKLATEFKVTPPTARAAVRYYLELHPEAKDQVHLSWRGPRRPRIEVAIFAKEARQLWESGWSKEKLAEKYGCSAPVIDKALELAYAEDGLPLPTSKLLLAEKIRQARQLLDSGTSLERIALTLKVTDVTARKYLRASFAAEGKPSPDLRRRRERKAS